MAFKARKGYFDWILVALVVALVAVGFVLQINATGRPTAPGDASLAEKLASADWTYPRLHVLWFGLGCLLGAVAIAISYHFYGRVKELIYWVNVALLAVVLVVGKVAGGAQSWFQVLGNRGFQPSEIAKLALIITLARQLADMPKGVQSFRQLFPVLLRVGIPLVLICAQPDFGTAMVYVVITAVMLYGAGTNWKFMTGLTLSGIAAFIPMWMFLITDKQKARFLVFLDPTLDVTGAGYQVRMSVAAVGSGQITGKGLFAPGAMSQLDYIPQQHTDFIFTVAAETWGFVGSILILLLYAALIWRLIQLSMQAGDRFGQLIILGVTAMILFHIVENIGMCLSVMPMTGIPLPFLSYGGSSMWSNTLAIALALNVGLRRGSYQIEGDLIP